MLLVSPEISFTNSKIWRAARHNDDTDNPTIRRAFESFVARARANCETYKDCELIPYKDRYGNPAFRVKYQNGWEHSLTLDPNVIEIPTKPASLAEFIKIQPLLDRDLFAVAKELGMKGGDLVYDGGCHVNVGLQSFSGDRLLFRNFLVDLVNHPELGRGIFYSNIENAPTLEDLELDQRKRFAELVAEFDRNEKMPPEDLARKIISDVYYKNPAEWDPPSKYHSINLDSFLLPLEKKDQWRLELRSQRSVENSEELLRILDLYESRLRYLATKREAIPLLLDVTRKKFTLGSSSQGIRDFYAYVTESGLEWKKYRPLLTEKYRVIEKRLKLEPTVPARTARCRGKLAAVHPGSS